MSRDEASDAALSACIRRTIAHAFQSGDPSALTLRLVREMVEQELGLEESFLKTDEFWGPESKRIVKEEVEIQNANLDARQPPSSPEAPKAAPKKRKAPATKAKSVEKLTKKTKTKAAAAKSAATVSASDDEDDDGAPKPKKSMLQKKKAAKSESTSPSESPRRTKSLSVTPATNPKKGAKRPVRRKGKNVIDDDEDDDDDVLSDLDDGFEGAGKRQKEKDESPPLSDLPSEDGNGKTELKDEAENKTSNGATAAEGSESEMSVLDEAPLPRKKRNSKSSTAKPKPASKGKKATEKAANNLSPSEEKIATLQKQLLKCGIRRIWKKELAPFSTAGEKISHLTGMLRDAGLVGQFSEAKAKKIKEERELRADIEAIQEGEERWGMSAGGRPKRGAAARGSARRAVADSDDDDEGDSQAEDGKPKRRLARGLKEDLAFLGDQSSDSN